MIDLELKRAMDSVYPKDEKYIDPMIKHLEAQRKLFTTNIGLDMGKDWYGIEGERFRANSLKYYVRKFLQATIIRQFQQGAATVKTMIKNADEHSGMASLDPIQMHVQGEEKQTETVGKVPAIFMEKIREQAKERRERARSVSRSLRSRSRA